MPEEEQLYEAHQQEISPEDYKLLAVYKTSLTLTKKAAGVNLRDAEKSIRVAGLERITEVGSPELKLCKLSLEILSESDQESLVTIEMHYRTDTEYSRSQFQQAADRAVKTWIKEISGSNYVSQAKPA